MPVPSARTSRLGYLPALDGLRALAIVLVVAHHAEGTETGRFQFGILGVEVFFVLSGFLITVLIAGQIQLDRFSRRRFYARRAIRLVPALVVVVAVFTPVGIVAMDSGRTLLGAVLALAYLSPFMTSTIFGHMWTLAVEEWFYLVWPVVLAKFFRDHLTMRQSALILGLIALVVQPFATVDPQQWLFRPSALLVGCALGLWWLAGGRVPWPSASLAVGLGMIVIGVAAGPRLWPLLPFWFAVVGSAFAIGAVACSSRGPLTRVLIVPPVVAVGVVSYEWYLLHFPMLKIAQERWGVDSWVWVVPLSLSLAFVLHHALVPVQRNLRRRLGDDSRDLAAGDGVPG